jgi:hypothetical protein
MTKLSSQRTYVLITGLILFLLGLLGFAFRASFTGIADRYLFAALVLGFWGLVLSTKNE